MWATKSSYMAFLWTKINTKTSFLHTHKQTKQKKQQVQLPTTLYNLIGK